MGDGLLHQQPLDLPRLPVLGFGAFRAEVPGRAGTVEDGRSTLLTTSARAAFLHALRAFGIGPGDRVLVPTYHCPTMISPVVRIGATPVYYPLASNGMPSFPALEATDTTGIRAMLAAHFFGLPLPLESVRRYCDARNIVLIEDCAHAFFGDIEGSPVGRIGDVALGSLPKFFPVNEGGCLAGPPELLAKVSLRGAPLLTELRSALDLVEIGARFGRFGALDPLLAAAFSLKDRLRGNGRARNRIPSPDLPASPLMAQTDPLLDEAATGRRMTRVTAWVMRQVDRGRIIGARRRNYALLAELAAELPGAQPLQRELAVGAVPYVFPLLVDRPESVYQAVRAAGVPVFRWDQLWPGTSVIEGDCGLHWSQHVFQIGCHQDLAERDIRSIVAVLRRLLSGSAA